MLRHRRITDAEATVEYDVDGNPFVHLRYRATGLTGLTDLDDLDEFMVDSLPPFMRSPARVLTTSGSGVSRMVRGCLPNPRRCGAPRPRRSA